MKMLFVISKGLEKSGGATCALQFASIAAERGRHVEVFLIDEAVHWAQVGMAGDPGLHREAMKEVLDKLILYQNIIHVCKDCADKRLISPDDLVNGSEISPAPVLVNMMANPDYKVCTF
jgi:sulfur relay (sulfurtransferase) complex TusBCD TusD component (DsrE family)